MSDRKVSKTDKDIDRVHLTFAEAQRFLEVSHQTLYDLINKKGLPSHKLGKRRIFFKDELLEWLKTQ